MYIYKSKNARSNKHIFNNEYQSVKKYILHIYRKQEDFNKAVTKDRYMCVCTWHVWKYTNTEFWYRYKPGSKCVCALTTPYT